MNQNDERAWLLHNRRASLYRTREAITMAVCFHRMEHNVTIPKGTRCVPTPDRTGQYWVDDLSWIDRRAEPFLFHDAKHRGIRLRADQVEAA